MKMVVGGVAQDELSDGNSTYECQCVVVGRWTGSCPDLATAQRDMELYCSNGGGCRAV